jgi:hypothetical protein
MTARGDEHWKFVERAVALLEKTLTPDARIELDVWLPELVTGTRRQVTQLSGMAGRRGPRSPLSKCKIEEGNLQAATSRGCPRSARSLEHSI